jgi:hypothetical protein
MRTAADVHFFLQTPLAQVRPITGKEPQKSLGNSGFGAAHHCFHLRLGPKIENLRRETPSSRGRRGEGLEALTFQERLMPSRIRVR